MGGQLTRVDVKAARADLENRTLAKIGLEFARLIYLASTRDYNTGRYYHDGLASRFSEEVAGKALAEAHLEIFQRLALLPLEDLLAEVQRYLQSLVAEPE